MRYLYSIIRAVILLTFTLFLPVNAVAAPVNLMPNVSVSMMNPEYWINKIPEPEKIIMTPREIEAFNQRIIQKQPGLVFDLTASPDTFSGKDLKTYINQRVPDVTTYIGKQQVRPSYYDNLVRLANLPAIKERNPVRYAVAIERTSLRVFPTMDVVSDEYDDPEYDLMQVSAVLANEPVLILHHSLDGKWYFARINNCQGWLPVSSVALCPDRSSWERYQKIRSFLTVTGNRIRLCTNPISPELSEKEFTMGCVLPLANPDEIPDLVDRQNPTGNYVVKLPVRGKSGQLEFRLALVPASSDVCEGYLPYTRANIIRQAFKLQGEKYGWGGILNARDCSSMAMEIYRSFGFRLPRNSSQQAASAGRTLTLKGHDTLTRQELLQELSPGAILHFSGHIMLYLGEDKGRHYIISDLGSYAVPNDDGEMETVRVHGVVVNDLYLMRKNGHMWIDELTVGKEIENSWFSDLEGHWATASVLELADRFVVRGRDDNTFDPDGTVTRAELAALVSRAFSLHNQKDGLIEQFDDVTNQWYARPVGLAVAAGLFQGDGLGHFNPGKICSRAELACVLARHLETSGLTADSGTGVLDRFVDGGEVPVWAALPIAELVEKGVMVGNQDHLLPLKAVTRAEAAVMVKKTLDIIENIPAK